jgi:hypothetical protein
MLFNSLTFVVSFALVLGAYWSVRSWEARKNLLLAASCIFYGAWNPPFALLLFATTALEDQATPRAGPWTRFLQETGAPGIYFEDYPELASFDCPEWSHLSGPDSVEFSKRLVPHLRKTLAP